MSARGHNRTGTADGRGSLARIRAAAIALAALLALLALTGGAGLVTAQESSRKTMAMREKVYAKLSRAQTAVEAEDWDEAFDKLDDVAKMKDLAPHEKAQLYTAYGYAYFSRQMYPESVEAYRKVLQQEDLPEALAAGTRYTLAQLWFHLENYAEAAGQLETWLVAATNPGPEAHVMLGQAYYQLGRLDDAVVQVRRAIEIADARGQPIRENWYSLLRAFYHEQGDHPRLLEVLEALVTRFPRKEYWLHLASTYGEMGDQSRQLAAYEAAFAQGFLTSGSERLLLAQLLLQAEVPYRAGVILARGLDDGLIESDARNWRLLSQAWTMAREPRRAIEALEKAAALSDDGELHARIAQSHADLGEWEQAVAAARTALDRGVRNPHELRIMTGMALFELGRLDEATEAFAQARRSPGGRKTASQWIAYIEREKERLRELEISLE